MIIVPESLSERLATSLMKPLMGLLAGAFNEAPQKTHFWNNRRLTSEEISFLNLGMMTESICDRSAKVRRRWIDFRFHLPLLGGWLQYVVIEPPLPRPEPWFVGWHSENLVGISRIPLYSPVRLLCGPHPTRFFGFTESGEQVSVNMRAQGVIGQAGPFCRIPLH